MIEPVPSDPAHVGPYMRIGVGGSCHWCTEGIFNSLRGVHGVLQGWISSDPPFNAPSEAVQLDFDQTVIPLETLVRIHLHSHSCTSRHSMRHKYRSAFYTYSEDQARTVEQVLARTRPEFERPIITQVLPFVSFTLNDPRYLNYYHSDPERPFCRNNITPKLLQLMKEFGTFMDQEKNAHLVSFVPDFLDDQPTKDAIP